MIISSLKTHKIKTKDRSLQAVLDAYLPKLTERTVVAITSKIVSICEQRIVKIGARDKDQLIKQEADYYLPPETNTYNIYLTIKNNLLVPTAGIDESNGNGYYILWPKNPQKSADAARAYLRKKFSLEQVGVIITDSTTRPLRRGVTGFAISHSGFAALKDYREKPDIFGRKLKVTLANMADGLAAAAVLAMGEGSEQTPLAIITDIPSIQFQKRNPNKKELKELTIQRKDDLYGHILNAVDWKRYNR